VVRSSDDAAAGAAVFSRLSSLSLSLTVLSSYIIVIFYFYTAYNIISYVCLRTSDNARIYVCIISYIYIYIYIS